ncbi:MAG: glycosyltransferase family 87 protein [Planctomycetaceae bacterium]
MFSDWIIGKRSVAFVALLLLVSGLAAAAVRTVWRYQVPGPADPYNEGYCDFHNGIYFPSSALLAGVSPYGSKYAAEYPVARQIPFFSPAIVAIHAPLSLLPLRAAELLYFAIMVGLVVAISTESVTAAGLPKRLDWVLVVAAGIVFSRAGHVTLFNGYFTFELVLAVILAVRWAEARPWLAAFALVIVSAKPTYILPLGFLMLARGNYRSLAYGAGLSIAAAALPLAWLAWNEGDGNVLNGLTEIRQQIAKAQETHHQEPNELPALSWTRIDLFAVYAKWTEQDPSDIAHLGVMAGILAVPMLLLVWRKRLRADDGIAGISGAIMMTARVVGLYRQFYDVLVLVPPIVGMAAARLEFWRGLGSVQRLVLALGMLFPAYNYLSTQMILGRLDLDPLSVKMITSVNGVLLAVLLTWLCFLIAKDSAAARLRERALGKNL